MAADLVYHPVPDLDDQVASFGDGHDGFRTEQGAVFGQAAQQRLGTDQLAGREIDLRLEEQLQLAIGHAAAQILLQGKLVAYPVTHVRRVEREAVATPFLGHVERGVGGADEILAVVGVVREDADPDARADVEPDAGDRDGLRDRLHDLAGERARVRTVPDALADDHELVPAEPRHRVLRPCSLLHAPCDDLQQLVAGAVPVGVVDLLEAIDIDHQQGDASAVPAATLEPVMQPGHGQHPVRQTRQAVVMDKVTQLFLGLSQRRDVGQHGDVVQELILFVPDRHQIDLEGLRCTVTASADELAVPVAGGVKRFDRIPACRRGRFVGTQQRRTPAENLLLREPRHVAIARVHGHHSQILVEQQDPFAGRLEDARRLAQPGLAVTPGADVLHHADDTPGAVPCAAKGLRLSAVPAYLACVRRSPEVDLPQRLPFLDVRQRGLDGGTILGMNVKPRQRAPVPLDLVRIAAHDPFGPPVPVKSSFGRIELPRPHLRRVERQTQPALADAQGLLAGASLQGDLDRGVQLSFGERLDQVTERFGLAGPGDRLVFRMCGQVDDGRSLVPRHPDGRVDAVDLPLEPDVHQHDVRIHLPVALERVDAARGGAQDIVAEPAQLFVQVEGDDGLVLDDHHGWHRHVSLPDTRGGER